MKFCNICPRKCNTDRTVSFGVCREQNEMRVARIAPHFFEEPPISGSNGSGTVFFCGCSLRCVFCQNKDISRDSSLGQSVSADGLYRAILSLQDSEVHNINLVTPTHFAHLIAPVLEKLKANGELTIPVVYNSSGYESIDTLKMLDGLVDIYLPDFKYASAELARQYSNAHDYPEIAAKAVCEMYRQVGKYKYSDQNPELLKSGLIIRHLVLPAHRFDSIDVLHKLCEILPHDGFLLSLMSQYTPDFALDTPHKNLHRRVTSFEYSSVCNEALALGLDGFFQQRESSSKKFTPDFSKKVDFIE